MKLPFNSPIGTDSTQVPLVGRSDRHSRTAQITHPETKYPIDHSVNPIDPHEHADSYRQTVRDLVAGMASGGSFDEDNLDALNNLINSWLQTWTSPALTTATRRREVAEQLFAQTLQHQTQVARELDDLHTERVEITAARDELLRQLHFADGTLHTERPLTKRPLPASRVLEMRPGTDLEPSEDAADPIGAVPVPINSPPHPTALPLAGFTATADTSATYH